MSATFQRYPLAMAAGGVMIIACTGTRFLLSGTTGSMDVRLDTGSDMKGLLDGQGYKGERFTTLTITDSSGASNAGFILVSDDDFQDNRRAGNVTTSPSQAGFTNAQATVTNASAQLLAASASRKYILIQNNDAAGSIFVRLDGVAATLLTGVKIPPGGSLVLEGSTLPNTAITAIGSIASNANIVVVSA